MMINIGITEDVITMVSNCAMDWFVYILKHLTSKEMNDENQLQGKMAVEGKILPVLCSIMYFITSLARKRPFPCILKKIILVMAASETPKLQDRFPIRQRRLDNKLGWSLNQRLQICKQFSTGTFNNIQLINQNYCL